MRTCKRWNIEVFFKMCKQHLKLAMAALRKTHKLSERVINSMLDLIMGKALVYFGLYNRQTPQLEGD